MNCTLEAIGEWAKQKFNLQKTPRRNSISKIKHEKISLKKSGNHGKMKRKNRPFLTSCSVETNITSSVSDLCEREVFISDPLIQVKARRIEIQINQHIPDRNKLHLKFRRGWLKTENSEQF